MVRLPATARLPITNVPAVIAARSDAATVIVPAPPATVIDLLPLGVMETVPVPAFTVPENVTSLAVIVIAVFVDDIDVAPALVTLPVPFVVRLTPFAPKMLLLAVMAPLDDVTRDKVLPELRAPETVILPAFENWKLPVAPDCEVRSEILPVFET